MAPIATADLPLSSLKSALADRKQGLKRSHDSLDDGSQDESQGSSQSPLKRKKVSWSDPPEAEIRLVDEFGGKKAVLIQEELRYAIAQHREGKHQEFEDVVSVFAQDPMDEDAATSITLQKHLLALRNLVTLLGQDCSALVNAVLDMEWLGRDDRLLYQYNRFIMSLVLVQGGYLKNVLQMVTKKFARHAAPQSIDSDGNAPLKERHDRLHVLLQSILSVRPDACGALLDILKKNYPFHADTARVHLRYSRNVIRITEYAPELSPQLLELITQNLVRIDVQVQVDIEDMDDGLVEDIIADEADYAEDKPVNNTSEDDDDGSDSEDEDEDQSEDPRIKNLTTSLRKLDTILDQLFEFYSGNLSASPATTPSSNSLQSQKSNLTHLLSTFQAHIFRTSQTRHTQFLLFRFIQANGPAQVSHLLRGWLQLLAEPRGTSQVAQISAANYIASFVARAQCVNTSHVITTFESLASIAGDLRRKSEIACGMGAAARSAGHAIRGASSVTVDPKRFSVYYASVQALLYIFCFRWRDLVVGASDTNSNLPIGSSAASDVSLPLSDDSLPNQDQDIELADDFADRPPKFPRAIREVFAIHFDSPLNPLRIIDETVVDVFAAVARATQVCYVYEILRRNKGARFTSATDIYGVGSRPGSSKEGARQRKAVERLPAFFPFDPMRLPRSSKWVRGWYREWRGAPGMGVEGQGQNQTGGAGVESSDEAGVEDDESDVSDGGDSDSD